MSRAVPSAAQLGAQRLVTSGYAVQQRQRVYLVRLGEDCKPGGDCAPGGFTEALRQWEEECKIPRNVFAKLVASWAGCECRNGPIDTPSAGGTSYQLDVALTFTGLERAGVPAHFLPFVRKTAPAFFKGAFFRAGRHLGDTGPSDALQWQLPYQGNELHALLFVHGFVQSNGTCVTSSDAGFMLFENVVREEIRRACTSCPVNAPANLLTSQWVEDSVELDPVNNAIHFGFVDGLSSPVFAKVEAPTELRQHEHHLGELLLGYKRDDGSNIWAIPKVTHQPSPNIAPSQSIGNDAGKFFKDGCFGAFRKMEQHVQTFDDYLTKEAAKVPGDHTYVKEWLKAKMVGRWANGDPVKEDQAPPTGRPLNTTESARMIPVPSSARPPNDFSFADDKEGFGCPYGAHIRRMNPRNDPVTPFVKRPLLRRGVPYGNLNAPAKGLLGLFLCASLEEQFEHLLGSWADNNPIGLPNKKAGKDPLIGNHEAQSSLIIPTRKAPAIELKELPAFVTTRGTSYVFFPSVHALKMIAKGA